MDYKYEIEYSIPMSLSFEDIRDCICKKIARLILLEENKTCIF